MRLVIHGARASSVFVCARRGHGPDSWSFWPIGFRERARARCIYTALFCHNIFYGDGATAGLTVSLIYALARARATGHRNTCGAVDTRNIIYTIYDAQRYARNSRDRGWVPGVKNYFVNNIIVTKRAQI